MLTCQELDPVSDYSFRTEIEIEIENSASKQLKSFLINTLYVIFNLSSRKEACAKYAFLGWE